MTTYMNLVRAIFE